MGGEGTKELPRGSRLAAGDRRPLTARGATGPNALGAGGAMGGCSRRWNPTTSQGGRKHEEATGAPSSRIFLFCIYLAKKMQNAWGFLPRAFRRFAHCGNAGGGVVNPNVPVCYTSYPTPCAVNG